MADRRAADGAAAQLATQLRGQRPAETSRLPPLPGEDMEPTVGDAPSNPRHYHQYVPIVRGMVRDWDLMEKVWHHLFYSELRVDPAEHLVVVSEKPLTPAASREMLVGMLFAKFRVPAVHVALAAVLALYGMTQRF